MAHGLSNKEVAARLGSASAAWRITAASATSSAPPESAVADEVARESARLNAWLDARFEEGLDFSPLAKTQLGRKDDYDRIDDISEAAREAQRAWMRETVSARA